MFYLMENEPGLASRITRTPTDNGRDPLGGSADSAELARLGLRCRRRAVARRGVGGGSSRVRVLDLATGAESAGPLPATLGAVRLVSGFERDPCHRALGAVRPDELLLRVLHPPDDLVRVTTRAGGNCVKCGDLPWRATAPGIRVGPGPRDGRGRDADSHFARLQETPRARRATAAASLRLRIRRPCRRPDVRERAVESPGPRCHFWRGARPRRRRVRARVEPGGHRAHQDPHLHRLHRVRRTPDSLRVIPPHAGSPSRGPARAGCWSPPSPTCGPTSSGPLWQRCPPPSSFGVGRAPTRGQARAW